MMLELQHYSVTVQYKRGVEMYLAYTLLRAFMTSTSPAEEFDDAEQVCHVTSELELEQ